MMPFTLGSVAGLGVVAFAAYRAGGRPFMGFVTTIFGVHTLASVGVASIAPTLAMPAIVYGQSSLLVHLLTIRRGVMPSWPWRALVTWPASVFMAGTFLAIPWAVVGTLWPHVPGLWLPYALAAAGALQAVMLRPEDVHITLDGKELPSLQRVAPARPGASQGLRVVQITDPHLGSFMSVERLRAVCERAVAAKPDLVVLTGDFLTVESHASASALTAALSPLRALEGRTFACFGNHDHEAPGAVTKALAEVGVRLLVDEMTRVDTALGPVEIVGFDFTWRDRKAHLARVMAAYPREAGVLRLGLLHDPGAFAHLPDGSVDLVFSGHTHGGQVGLLSFGLVKTAVSALSAVPDHGLWALGAMRLYVHRGTGHYGFPVRLGVPPEESVVHVHRG